MASNLPPGSDLTLEYLKKLGVEINRKNYVQLRFMDPAVKHEDYMGPEIESDFPRELQHREFRGDDKD
jgi:hypothetical protein